MLNDYFRHQAGIINIESHFRCPDDCNAPGCWMEDVIAETTLFDLIRLKRLLVKMKKPCPFLCGNRCLVHDAKPLNCILFPEYYEIEGLLPELTKKKKSPFP